MTVTPKASILISSNFLSQNTKLMNQLSLFAPPSWTVSELNGYLRELFESDANLQDVWVSGEISTLSRPASGHLYFTLKDEKSALRCVMWRNMVLRLPRLPQSGEAVEVHGSVSVYEAGGQYQLYADLIRPQGEGALYQAFLRLKARLESEGLFASERKRPLPDWPRRIGVVTSPTGAALRDILNTLMRRYPLAEVILAPTLVQGSEAPAAIIQALKSLNQIAQPDLILLARGGGSLEDLWAFNDEGVARAVVESTAPVITGVGHETDFSIVDFVSDLRAPTPTAAAELATPNKLDLQSMLDNRRDSLNTLILSSLEKERWSWSLLAQRIKQLSPQTQIRNDRQRLDEFTSRCSRAAVYTLSLLHSRRDGLTQRLGILNPNAVLQRGYALVTSAEGEILRRVAQIQPDMSLQVQVSDGSFRARVMPEPLDGGDESAAK